MATVKRFPLRAPQVCQALGISYRQLDYWIRIGYVGDPQNGRGGSGTQRLFDERHFAEVEEVRELFARIDDVRYELAQRRERRMADREATTGGGEDDYWRRRRPA